MTLLPPKCNFLWSLRCVKMKLMEVNASGVVLDSIHHNLYQVGQKHAKVYQCTFTLLEILHQECSIYQIHTVIWMKTLNTLTTLETNIFIFTPRQEVLHIVAFFLLKELTWILNYYTLRRIGSFHCSQSSQTTFCSSSVRCTDVFTSLK